MLLNREEGVMGIRRVTNTVMKLTLPTFRSETRRILLEYFMSQ